MAPFLWFLLGGVAGGYVGSKVGLTLGVIGGGAAGAGLSLATAAAIRKRLSPHAQAEFDAAMVGLTPEEVSAVLAADDDEDLKRIMGVAEIHWKNRQAWVAHLKNVRPQAHAAGALWTSHGYGQYATGGFNLGNVLGKIAKVAGGAGAVVASVLVPPLAPVGVPVAANLITSAVVSGDGVVTATVNPVWTKVSRVLGEAATELRASVSYDAQTTLHTASLVDRLATLAYDLALSPGNYAIETDFRNLGHWLSSHPRSEQLAAYIATHPELADVFSEPDSVGQMRPRPPPPEAPMDQYRQYGRQHYHRGGGGEPQRGHKDSWQRWQRVHPGSSFQDYQGWWQQHGQYGAQIN